MELEEIIDVLEREVEKTVSIGEGFDQLTLQQLYELKKNNPGYFQVSFYVDINEEALDDEIEGRILMLEKRGIAC